MCTSMKCPYPVEVQSCNVAIRAPAHSLDQLIVKVKGQVAVVVEIITCVGMFLWQQAERQDLILASGIMR